MSKASVRRFGWMSGLAVLFAAGAFASYKSAVGGGLFSTDGPIPDADAKPKEEVRLPLAETERGFLWAVEHHGHLLNKYGFKPFANELRQADRDKLKKLVAVDFQGQSYHKPSQIGVQRPYLKAIREEGNETEETLTAEQFVDRLLGFRTRFKQPPNVAFSLMTLTPKDRQKMEETWQGECLLRLWGEQKPGQPCEVVLTLRYEVAAPAQQMAARGGWLKRCALTQSLTTWAEHPLFKETAAQRGIDPNLFFDGWKNKGAININPGGVYVTDFNRDGILDVLVTDLRTGYFLFQGLPEGRFRDVTLEVGLPRQPFPIRCATVAAFADLDGDGWEDLILGGKTYRNDHGRFVDWTEHTNLGLAPDCTGVAIADFDRDGRLDLYVTRPTPSETDSWVDGKGGANHGNWLLHNKGNWQFEEVAQERGAAGGRRSTFTALWLDINNDGWPDLYVPNEYGPGILLINEGGRFREQELGGPGDFGTMGATCGDWNNDGHIDLYAANMYSKAGNRVFTSLNCCQHPYSETELHSFRQFVAGSQLYRNLGDYRLEPVGKKFQLNSVGWVYGPAMIDFDNDGWLDVFATAGFLSVDRNEPDG